MRMCNKIQVKVKVTKINTVWRMGRGKTKKS